MFDGFAKLLRIRDRFCNQYAIEGVEPNPGNRLPQMPDLHAMALMAVSAPGLGSFLSVQSGFVRIRAMIVAEQIRTCFQDAS